MKPKTNKSNNDSLGLVAETPIVFRVSTNGYIDIKPICDVYKIASSLYVYGVNGWTKANPMYKDDNIKPIRYIYAHNAFLQLSDNCVLVNNDNQEKICKDIKPGHKLHTIGLPVCYDTDIELHKDEATLLGMLLGGGRCSDGMIVFVSPSYKVRHQFKTLWEAIGGGGCNHMASRWNQDGYITEDIVCCLECCGNLSWLKKYEWYCDNGKARIPYQIFNSSVENARAFLDGFSLCRDLYTTSSVLAAGLLLVMSRVTSQPYNLVVDIPVFPDCKINIQLGNVFNMPNQVIDSGEVDYDGYLYNLKTENGTMCVGVGQGYIKT